MSLRTKIILFFALLTSLTIASLTAYSTYFQRKTYFENERLAQQQVISLLKNYVAAQYYNYVDDQIGEVMNLRTELEVKAQVIKHQVLSIFESGLPPRTKEDYVFAILNLAKGGFDEVGIDLVVATNNEVLLKPKYSNVEQLSSVNNRRLVSLLQNTAANQSIDGYFLFLYSSAMLGKQEATGIPEETTESDTALELICRNMLTEQSEVSEPSAVSVDGMPAVADEDVIEKQMYSQQGDQKRYLSYIFTISPDLPYSVALIQNIDELFSYYDVSNTTMVDRMREHFESLYLSLNGEALIVDAKSSKLLLSTDAHHPLFKVMPEEVKQWCEQARVSERERLKHINVEDEESVDFSTFETGEVMVNGESYIISCTYYKPLDWYILNLLDRDTIVRPASEHAMVQLSFSQLLLFFAIFAAILWGRKMTHSLTLMSRKAAVISSTNLSDVNAVREITSSITIEGNDEIAQLSKAFNRMGVSLSHNINQLMNVTAVTNRMEGELKAAREIQLGMLPEDYALPSSQTMTHAAFLCPAKEVGGDFYDIFRLDDDHLVYTIGDVSDKGVPAALFMSMTMNLARTCLYMHMSPADTMHVINDRLSERNPNMMFVTMFIAIVEESTGKVTACNAGHCPPIVVRKTHIMPQCEQWEEINGPAVGPMSGMEYSQYEKTLEEGDLLLLYTDGVSEAQNSKQEFFKVDSILECALNHAQEEPEPFVSSLNDRVKAFRDQYVQTDDITIVSCKRRKE